MANTVRITARTDDKASGPIDDIRDKFDKLQKQGAKGFGIGIAAGATTFGLNAIASAADAAATAVIGFGIDSVNAASDLNETISKSDVIFGQNADAVQSWADTMAMAAGQSKRSALDAASGFAGLFKTVGLGIDQSTQMSENLTQMGSDLASFFNTDVDQALEALKSGLNGESEPLRAFNVFLSETAVSAKLAEMGVKKTGGAFTEAQKATARYALIMEQTTDAQGDFARTADGQANSTRQLNAEIENLQAEIGQHLLPIVKELTVWAKDDLVPALESVFRWVESNKGAFEALGFTVDSMANGPIAALTHKYADLQEASNKAFAQRILDNIDAVKKAHQGVGQAASIEAGKMKDLGKATMTVVDAQGEMRDIIRGVAKTLGDQKFGHKELRLELQGNKLDLRDNIDKLHDLEAVKHPTRDTRQDIIDTKLAIIDNKKEAIHLRGELAATGKVSLSVTENWVDRLRKSLDEAGTSAATLRARMLAIPGASTGGGGGGGGGGGSHLPKPPVPSARGGHRNANQLLLVGEEGPELFRPDSAGTVIPNGGGGGLVVNVYAQVLTPGAAQALAAEIAPHVTRWQQQRGL